MLRKLAPATLVLGLLAAACGAPDVVVRSGGQGEVRFFPGVLDAAGDVGRGLSMATDGQGDPHLAYLAFEEELETGQPPPAPDPDAPILPAVVHAHVVEDARTRSVVAEETAVTPEDQTAIAVDGDGVHHVVWTEEGSLLYSNNAEGAFSEGQEITADGPVGPSIAVAGTTPWVAFSVETGVEGPGGLVRVATPEGDRWSVETAAETGASGQTAIAAVDGEVLVAYGSEGATMVARGPGPWASETADPDGGVGVSMAVDGDGNPHVAYETAGGAVKHAHSTGGGPWEVSEVADGADAAAGGATIALDEDGVHHVAWASSEGIGYANNEEDGSFAAEEVPASQGGTLPRIGIGPDGEVLLAWFDTGDTEVQLAVRSEEPPLLALPGAPTGEPAPGPTGPPTGPPPCEPDGADLASVAPPGASGTGFDTDCMAVPAGEAFAVDFTNDDSTVHNWALYTDSSAEEHLGGGTIQEQIGAGESTTYDVDPIDEPGQYFFRCDFHPTTMTGTFVVAEG
ncbi:MAG: cupredoxin domain-containing protein [Actinomycetota bacterium]